MEENENVEIIQNEEFVTEEIITEPEIVAEVVEIITEPEIVSEVVEIINNTFKRKSHPRNWKG
jgi:hypothetical protein